MAAKKKTAKKSKKKSKKKAIKKQPLPDGIAEGILVPHDFILPKTDYISGPISVTIIDKDRLETIDKLATAICDLAQALKAAPHTAITGCTAIGGLEGDCFSVRT